MIPLSRQKLFISLILVALISGFPSVSQAQSPFVIGAAFSATPTSGTAPLTVAFSDESIGSPTGWAWYFGDEDFSADWTQVTTSAEWTARTNFSSIMFPDGSIVIMGGRDDSSYKNDVWRSTDGGESWTLVTDSAPWSARGCHTSVILPDGSIVLMGGEDMLNYKNDVWRSTDGGTNWTMLTSGAEWSGRTRLSSVVLQDGSILVMGGAGIGLVLHNDVWRSTDNGATWTQLTGDAGWSARYDHTSVVLPDGSIVLMGGSPSIISNANDVWRSIDGGQTWNELTDNAGWSARTRHTSVVMPDGSIVLMGGFDGSVYQNDVWRSTDNGATWMALSGSVGWAARDSHSSVVLPNGSIVLMGGFSHMGSYVNDVWRLETAGSSLQNPEHTYTETGLYSVSLQAYKAAAFAQARKIGYVYVHNTPVQADFNADPTDGVKPLMVQFNDQTTQDPGTWAWYFGDEDFSDDWEKVAENPGWEGRSDHSSVVLQDGSILLMGGSDGFWSMGNDVWRSTDGGETWTQVTAHADWSARIGHSSVVLSDGSVLLMGGYSFSSDYQNDIWRSIDNGATWSLVTGNPGWDPRSSHSSLVLQDGSILVMGGYLSTGSANDVWRSTDNGATWTQITADAGWSDLERFSSVVLPDGSIVIMGGYTGSYYKNDVWRSTNNGATWIQLTAGADWSERAYHTSVVLPDGSIVLMGGSGESGYSNDVWRSTDLGATWDQLTGDVGWLPRGSHSSVVLPDGRIILTGGFDNNGLINDVWRLTTAGSNLQNPQHIYQSTGRHTVLLSVSGADSKDREIKTDYVDVLFGVILPLFFR